MMNWRLVQYNNNLLIYLATTNAEYLHKSNTATWGMDSTEIDITPTTESNA